MTSLGLEYFCNEGDELWNSPDQELVELGKREIEKIGLAKSRMLSMVCIPGGEVLPGLRFELCRTLAVIRAYIDSLENFQTIGRNGLHRYNNQDHAMLTGMLAVRNILFKEKNDLWVVNAEQEYHEEELGTDDAGLQTILNDAFSEHFPIRYFVLRYRFRCCNRCVVDAVYPDRHHAADVFSDGLLIIVEPIFPRICANYLGQPWWIFLWFFYSGFCCRLAHCFLA